MTWLALMLACTTLGDPDPTETETTSATESVVDTEPLELTGTVPDEAISCPTFAATAQDDTPRSRDDLLGHATVMWFYPAAGTAG